MKIDLLPLCGVVLAAWPVVAQAESAQDYLLNRIELLLGDTEANCWGGYHFFQRATVQDVQACLDAGADIEWHNKNGETVLMHVVEFVGSGSRSEIVKLLLDAGADPNAQDHGGRSALHGAAMWGLDRTVKVLLDAGADPNVQNEDGDTPLEVVTVFGRPEAVRDLLLPYAKPDERWHCTGSFDLTLTTVGDAGIVAVDGLPDQFTAFQIDGFNRVWNWCLEDGYYKCSFVIKPSKQGAYYKFLPDEDTAKPESRHTCTKAD